jgi:hypothetical protein
MVIETRESPRRTVDAQRLEIITRSFLKSAIGLSS